jgi:hypothetical protein
LDRKFFPSEIAAYRERLKAFQKEKKAADARRKGESSERAFDWLHVAWKRHSASGRRKFACRFILRLP